MYLQIFPECTQGFGGYGVDTNSVHATSDYDLDLGAWQLTPSL